MEIDAPTEREIHALMGRALLASQTADWMLKTCLTFVLQEDPPLTLSKYQQLERKQKRKTLGYLIERLRERADIHEDLESLLGEYLESRNTFIHSVRDIPGWDLSSASGRGIAKEFVVRFSFVVVQVSMIFAGLLGAWQVENLIDVETTPEQRKLSDELDRSYVPLANHYFVEKEGKWGVSGILCARRNMTKRNRYAKQKDHQGGRVSVAARDPQRAD